MGDCSSKSWNTLMEFEIWLNTGSQSTQFVNRNTGRIFNFISITSTLSHNKETLEKVFVVLCCIILLSTFVQKLVGQERFILLRFPNRSKKGLKNNLEVKTEAVAMEESCLLVCTPWFVHSAFLYLQSHQEWHQTVGWSLLQ